MSGRRRRAAAFGPEPAAGSDVDDLGQSDPEEIARAIALRRLTSAPQTRAQLAEAMARRGVPDEVADRVLDRFEEVRLVDDAAYAQAWVTSRVAGRGLARRALRHELSARGVSPADVASALDALDPAAEEDGREGAGRPSTRLDVRAAVPGPGPPAGRHARPQGSRRRHRDAGRPRGAGRGGRRARRRSDPETAAGPTPAVGRG